MQMTEDVDWIQRLRRPLRPRGRRPRPAAGPADRRPGPAGAGRGWHDADDDSPRAFFAWALALEAPLARRLRRHRRLPLLRRLRGDADPGVLPDRRLRPRGPGLAALKFLMFQLGGGLVLLGSVIGLYVVSAQRARRRTCSPTCRARHVHRAPSGGCSRASSSPSRSRRRCSRCTPGWPTPPSRPRPAPACCWSACSTRSAPSGCCASASGCSRRPRSGRRRWSIVLALISIVYGAFVAIGQDDLLRLIGLTSLSHFGFITLGIFVVQQPGRVRLDPLHGQPRRRAPPRCSCSPAIVINRRGTSLIAEMGGVEKATPVCAGLFLVAGLATLGLPGPEPFVSEILVLISPSTTPGRSARSPSPASCWPRSTCSGPTSDFTGPDTAGRRTTGVPAATSAAARSARSPRSCWRWCCSASTRCRCSTSATLRRATSSSTSA